MSDQPENTPADPVVAVVAVVPVDPVDPVDPHAEVNRRTVLRVAGVGGAGVAGAVALAACGGSTTPPSTGSAPSTSSAAGSAGSSSAAGSSSGSAGSGAPSGTPVKTSTVPVGGGVIDPAALFVVTQPSAGEFKAFSAICTHQGCAVTRVQNGHIVCPCHGSQFDITTGTPTASSEAKKPLPAKTATVDGDLVYVA